MTQVRVDLLPETVGKTHYASKVVHLPAQVVYARLLDALVQGLSVDDLTGILGHTNAEDIFMSLKARCAYLGKGS